MVGAIVVMLEEIFNVMVVIFIVSMMKETSLLSVEFLVRGVLV